MAVSRTLLVVVMCGYMMKVETMKLVNNGYEDLVVAIGQDVPEDNDYFPQIETILKKTSAYLYTATRHRAYIRTVKVLVPKTWPDDPSRYTDPGEATFDNADIRIDEPNPVHGRNPYTFQPGQCGDPGQYIHLTPDYVLDRPGVNREVNWGDPGRLLVHEFAHLRYGVFDEYGTKGDDLHPAVYLNDKGVIVPTGCTANMNGTFNRECTVNKTSNLPTKNCDFIVTDDNDAIASIMYAQYLNTVTDFCESNPTDPRLQHNSVAPTLQNTMCNKGTWDVIKEHPDFKSSNPPRAVPDTTPVFHYVYNRRGYWHDGTEKCGRRVVLILDLSASMRHFNTRWFKQTQTADKFIRDILPIGSNIGIVTFSTNATIWSPMTPLRSNSVKNAIANALPMYRDIGGNTAIGKAFQTGLNFLESTGGTKGGRILLITDGEETETPHVADIMNDIISAGVVVHTVAYSNGASKSLVDISQKTGGMYAYFSESNVSTTLDSAIRRLYDDMAVCKERTPVEIFRKSVMVTGIVPYHGQVDIDDTLGLDTVFVFTFPYKAQMEAQVTSPHGAVYDRKSANYTHDTKLNIVRLRLQITVNNTGSWAYTLRSTSGDSHIVGITVTSKPYDKKSTIEFRAWLSGLSITPSSKPTVYAHVHKGYSPVVYANVTISIESPGGKADIVYPKDDGNPPDNTKDDGIYTTYFVGFKSNDRYSLDGSVSNIPGKTAFFVSGNASAVFLSGPASGRAKSRNYYSTETAVLEQVTKQFTRTFSPGTIHVSHVSSEKDKTIPKRITDLRGRTVNRESRTVSLRWTAPGDDYDQGMVTKYKLLVGHSFDQLRSSFHETKLIDEVFFSVENIIPFPAGQQQEIILTIPVSVNQSVLVFGMKAVDKASQTSELSNLIALTFKPVQTKTRSCRNAVQSQVEDKKDIPGIIVFGVAGISCLVMVVVVIAVVKKNAVMRNNFTDIESQCPPTKVS